MEGTRGEVEAPFSVSLGAIGPILNKLDMMLGPQGCKLPKGLHDRFHLLKDNVEEISAYLEDLLEVEDPPMAVKCWMKEAHELSYDILDYIDSRVSLELLECRSVRKMGLIKIAKKLKWQKQIEYAAPHVPEHVIPKTICVDVIRAPRGLKWYQQMIEKVSEFRIYALEAIRRNYLHGKRYLIIVDDLWDTSAWDVINQVFPKGSQGSRIITTTQIEDVALACCCDHPEQVFEMKPLDDGHSRKLFFGRIFGSESDCPEEFKQISSQIVEICAGLPLATISIASVLANHPSVSVDLFTHIHDSLVSCLSSNSTSERTRHVLNLSYNNLPHYLKTCLLYFSMYPVGSIIFKLDLARQWVAEGFIAASEGQDTEEVAGTYFDELVDRRFIQPVSINFNNEVVSCTVHAVVHDLIVHKSAEENFLVVVDCNRKNLTLSHKVRRLSLQLGDAKYAKIPANIRKSQVRSLGVFGLSESMPCIEEFKLVRVLNLHLSGHHNGDQGLSIDLTTVSELFHLRYLKIVCDVCIKLPKRMRGLQCLETLDVMDTPRGTYVPWDIIYLPRLLHLSLPPHTNLLDWSVGDDMCLCKPNHLQDLCISTPPSSDSDHLKRSMEALDYLMYEHDSLKTVKLVTHGSSVSYGDASKARVSWMLNKATHHVQRLELSAHSPVIFGDLYLWMKQLGNLCIVKIAVHGLSVNDVDILRGLTALTALSLYVDKSPNIKIIFGTAAGFAALKYLKLRFMSGIAWLRFEADAMPNLWKLRLVFDAIPQMDQRLELYSVRDQWRQYRHGNALISIEHMTGLREVSTKFGGAAADLQYVSRTGIVSNHPSNPIMEVKLVDSGSHGDKRISTESSSRLKPPGVEEGGEQQTVVSWSNTIDVIGRELFIRCLHLVPRWDYGAIASLNHGFNSVVRNGDIYRLRRKNGVAEHL
ncbi:hypothetical protein ZWY2020_047441 [Hordeum vulgare]|nr:hypothetical protein ZWY2020_047441 [Hordeum vulgare]